jgi:uncharacterized protein YutE (UPF0331/DUF86 family)
MIFEQGLKRVADGYIGQGYRVTVHPQPTDLPGFARDFKLEICATRGREGVLVAVRTNRIVFAADPELSRYAEVIGTQAHWRFDFVILEAEPPGTSSLGKDARELSDEEIETSLADAERANDMGLTRAAIVTAWAALEASMRMMLRASDAPAGWGTSSKSMTNKLYSNGMISSDEFVRLETLAQLRNQIVHGFGTSALDGQTVKFIADLARRLRAESIIEVVPA